MESCPSTGCCPRRVLGPPFTIQWLHLQQSLPNFKADCWGAFKFWWENFKIYCLLPYFQYLSYKNVEVYGYMYGTFDICSKMFQDCTRAYLINLLSASPLGNLFLCSHLCSHSVPIICWMLFKVAFLPPSGKYMANDVDGRPTSGNPDDTCNWLQPIKCALRPFISGELHSAQHN
jgi:hypothetical protein